MQIVDQIGANINSKTNNKANPLSYYSTLIGDYF
jgi:hypothetical protein